MKKYILGAILSLSILVSPAFTHAAGLSNEQVQAILSLLSSFGADSTVIASVNTALTGSGSTSGGTSSTSTSSAAYCHKFNSDLTFGSNVNEANSLQEALVRENVLSSSKDGFTEEVAAAVVKFQAKYGIRQTGYVGPLTRAKLNSLYGCSTTVTTPTQTYSYSFEKTAALIGKMIVDLVPDDLAYDINKDGRIDLSDQLKYLNTTSIPSALVNEDKAYLVGRMIVGTLPVNLAYDINGDGQITLADSLAYLKLSQAPSITVASVSGMDITAQYANIPTGVYAEINVINQSTGVAITNYDLRQGGTGTATIHLDASLVSSGPYYAVVAYGSKPWPTSGVFQLQGTAPTCSVTVSTVGGSPTVTWTSTGAASATTDLYYVQSGKYDSIQVKGSQAVTVSNPTIYSFWFTGPGGQATCVSSTITPTATTPAPSITSFSASPANITSGGSTTLSWSTSNTNQCGLGATTQGSPGLDLANATVNSAGMHSVNTGALTQTTTYELRCAPLGTTGDYAIQNVTVTVATAASTPTATIDQSSLTTTSLGPTTITGTASGSGSVYVYMPSSTYTGGLDYNSVSNAVQGESPTQSAVTAYPYPSVVSNGRWSAYFGGSFPSNPGPRKIVVYDATSKELLAQGTLAVTTPAPTASVTSSLIATANTSTTISGTAQNTPHVKIFLLLGTTQSMSTVVPVTNDNWTITYPPGYSAGSWTVRVHACTSSSPTSCSLSTSLTIRTLTVTPAPVTCSKGDVDGNGTISQADQEQVLRHVTGLVTLTDSEKGRADVNGDGLVQLTDGIDIGKYIVRLITAFPACATGTVGLPIAVVTSGLNQTASAINAYNSAANAGVSQNTDNLHYVWNRDLQVGSPYFADVTALQRALVRESVYAGEVTGGFYSQTYSAVQAFQRKYGIDATGFVGSITRTKLNELY